MFPLMLEKILDELHRVLKKDGVSRIVIPPWFSPHAGHKISPFHILPFRLAVYLAKHVMGKSTKAKSLQELGLYPITFSQMSKLIEKHGFKIIFCNDVLLRNHILTRIPIIREFLIPSAAFNIGKIQNRVPEHSDFSESYTCSGKQESRNIRFIKK